MVALAANPQQQQSKKNQAPQDRQSIRRGLSIFLRSASAFRSRVGRGSPDPALLSDRKVSSPPIRIIRVHPRLKLIRFFHERHNRESKIENSKIFQAPQSGTARPTTRTPLHSRGLRKSTVRKSCGAKYFCIPSKLCLSPLSILSYPCALSPIRVCCSTMLRLTTP
jgi:hypothetical protein